MNGYRRNRACSCARCRCSGYMGPIVLVTLGVLFLVGEYTPYDFAHTTWPVFLIVVGIVLLVQRRASVTGHVNPWQIDSGAPPPVGGSPGGGPASPSDGQQVTHG